MKRKLLAVIMCVMLATMTACGNKETNENSKTKDVAKKTETTVTKTDTEKETPVEVDWTLEQIGLIPNVVANISNITAQQSAEPLDIASHVAYDENIVTGIEVDDASVDYNTPGTYTATYCITMNRKAFEDYVAENNVTGLDITSDTKTFVAKVAITVTIVAPEQAQTLEEQGTAVATAENTGTKPANTGSSNKPSNSNSGNTSNNSNTAPTNTNNSGGSGNTSNASSGGNSSNNNTNSSTPSGNTGGNTSSGGGTSNSSGNTTTPVNPTPAPAQPTHEHQWMPHYATRVIKEAYDEQVTKTVTEYEEHIFENGTNRDLTIAYKNDPDSATMTFSEWSTWNCIFSYHNDLVPVQKTVTETVHHDAVTEQYIDYYYCADNSCGATKAP